MQRRNNLRVLIGVLAAFLMAGCAVAPLSPEEQSYMDKITAQHVKIDCRGIVRNIFAISPFLVFLF